MAQSSLLSPKFHQNVDKDRGSRLEEFCKKVVLRNFAKFTGKHLCQSIFFLNKVAGLRPAILLKKEILAQVFACEFCEISKNIFSYRTSPVAVNLCEFFEKSFFCSSVKCDPSFFTFL